MIETFTVDFEVTDTFGGEANYSWVRRKSVTLPCNISDRAVMRRLKAFAGFSGLRGRSYHNGDTWEFRPFRMCQVAFATTRY